MGMDSECCKNCLRSLLRTDTPLIDGNGNRVFVFCNLECTKEYVEKKVSNMNQSEWDIKSSSQSKQRKRAQLKALRRRERKTRFL